MAPPDAPRPMLARMVDDLPVGPGWLYEPKWDGFRCIVTLQADSTVRLLSRRGKSLNNAFPDIVTAARNQLPPGTIADGGIVRWSTTGRLDFEALQRRNRSAGRGAQNLARTEHCDLILFDLLRLQDHDLTGSPLTDRRAELEQLLDDTGAAVLVAGMQTDDLEVARVWFDQLAAVGVEGIVAKRADEPYRPGTRSWVKIKHYATTEAIVGGVTGPLERPDSLVLGRFYTNDGQLHIVGRSTELHPPRLNRSPPRSHPSATSTPGRPNCRCPGTTAQHATTTASSPIWSSRSASTSPPPTPSTDQVTGATASACCASEPSSTSATCHAI